MEGTLPPRTETYPLWVTSAAQTVRLVPRLRWRIIQVAADFATVFAAAMGSYGLYLWSELGKRHFDPAFYAQIHLTFAAITVFALHGYGTYRGQLGLLRIESVRKILYAVTAGLLLTLAISFLLRLPTFSRINVVMVGPVIVVALVLQRFALWKAQDRARARRGTTPVVVFGAGETGRLLAQRLLQDHSLGLKPAAFLDDNPEMTGQEIRVGPGVDGERVPVVGTDADLDEIIRRTGATAVFLAMPSAASARIASLVARLEERRLHYFCVPSAGDLLFWGLQFGQVGGLPVFTRRQPADTPAYLAGKRALDVVGASLLLLFTSPILGLAAALVRLTSNGPVLFSQQRVGLHGRRFTIYKLRTMWSEAPKYGLHPDRVDDTRVTPVGRWLRRLSIDELPQLWNVLRGEMSLVGPRPEMPFMVEEYGDIARQRLAVKPGVTGLWQISADRAFRIHDNLQYDLYYIENRSLALDLAILIMTPLMLLGRNGAQ